MISLSAKLRSCASLARASRSMPRPASSSSSSSSLVVTRSLLSLCQTRHSSHSPLGSSSTPSRKKVTLGTLRSMHKKNEPITMITAHDFPSAHVADEAGMDMILVGDSLAMVALGMEDTSEVLVEEMLLHCRSVARATRSAFTVSILLLFLILISVFVFNLACLRHISYHPATSHTSRVPSPHRPRGSPQTKKNIDSLPGWRPPHGLIRDFPRASP